MVHARECVPLQGEMAVEWFLRILPAAQARRGLLKSGRAGHLAFHSAERLLQRGFTIQAIIAWRLMLMTLLVREAPEYGTGLMFTDIELRFLDDHAGATHPVLSSAATRTSSMTPTWTPDHVAWKRTHVPRHSRLTERRESPGRRLSTPHS